MDFVLLYRECLVKFFIQAITSVEEDVEQLIFPTASNALTTMP